MQKFIERFLICVTTRVARTTRDIVQYGSLKSREGRTKPGFLKKPGFLTLLISNRIEI
jgi:hypothetical protein